MNGSAQTFRMSLNRPIHDLERCFRVKGQLREESRKNGRCMRYEMRYVQVRVRRG